LQDVRGRKAIEKIERAVARMESFIAKDTRKVSRETLRVRRTEEIGHPYKGMGGRTKLVRKGTHT